MTTVAQQQESSECSHSHYWSYQNTMRPQQITSQGLYLYKFNRETQKRTHLYADVAHS